MKANRHPRPALLFAVGLLVTGAFAVLGSAPAFSYTHIYGSGAALQGQLQGDILIPQSPSLGSLVTYTATSSGKGFEEFGNENGALNLTLDTTADKLTPAAELDAYTATDSAPTSTQLSNAQKAADGSTNEIAVPVAQTPLDLLLSLPSGIKLNAAQSIDLNATLASQLYAGTVPQPSPNPESYAVNTWGAFLTDVGLTETSNTSPALGEFYDSGTSGGTTTISVEIRKSGAGTTLNLKQYLFYVDAEAGLTEWASPIKEDATACGTNEWPATATIEPCTAGNNTDANEVEAVDGTPGTIGYATAGDASDTTTTKFTNLPLTSTDPPISGGTVSASHQILYALLQDNYGSRGAPIYADPEANSSGTANVYTGSNIDVNGNTAGGVGNWVVPNTGGTFNTDNSWSGTRASDPDVYNDSGDAVAYYPLVAVAFDLSWSNFSVGNLTSDYGGENAEVQATTKAFLEFATSNTGQNDILKGGYYYAPLPSDVGNSGLANIQAVANAAASGV